MKIAVCISGMQRNVHRPIKDIINSIQNAFPDADFYYHTWKGKEIDSSYNIMTSPEPVLDYHPVYDNIEFTEYWKKYRSKIYNDPRWGQENFLVKMKHANKQILAHAFILDNITNYDIIIRTRWDAWFSDKINYRQLVEEAYDKDVPFGFETKFVKSKHKIVDTNPIKPVIHKKWFKRIKDYMIIHKPKHFNTKMVYDLHKKKKLWSGEPGWYQIMSQPFNDHHKTFKNAIWIIR